MKAFPLIRALFLAAGASFGWSMDLPSYAAWYTSLPTGREANALFEQDNAKFLAAYVKHHIERGEYKADQPNLDEIRKKILRILTINYEYTKNAKKVFESAEELKSLVADPALDQLIRRDLLIPLYIETGDVVYAARAIEIIPDIPALFIAVADKNFDRILRQIFVDSYSSVIDTDESVVAKSAFTRISVDLLHASVFQGDYQTTKKLFMENYAFFSRHSAGRVVEFAKALLAISKDDYDRFLVILCSDDGGAARLILDDLIINQVTDYDYLRTILESDAHVRMRRLNKLSPPPASGGGK